MSVGRHLPLRRIKKNKFVHLFFRAILPALFIICVQILAAFNIIFGILPNLHFTYVKWLLALFIIANLMFIYCYGLTAIRNPGTPEWILSKVHRPTWLTDQMISNLPKCPKCGGPKPPRCHHCKRCNKCHLRLDHHCPAVGHCVALGNHQNFCVMLIWASILCAIATLTQVLTKTRRSELKPIKYIIGGADIIMGFMCFAFFLQHYKMISRNETTFDNLFNGQSEYDIGPKENRKQIFGDSWFGYIFPVLPHITGFEYCLPEYHNPTMVL